MNAELRRYLKQAVSDAKKARLPVKFIGDGACYQCNRPLSSGRRFCNHDCSSAWWERMRAGYKPSSFKG